MSPRATYDDSHPFDDLPAEPGPNGGAPIESKREVLPSGFRTFGELKPASESPSEQLKHNAMLAAELYGGQTDPQIIRRYGNWAVGTANLTPFVAPTLAGADTAYHTGRGELGEAAGSAVGMLAGPIARRIAGIDPKMLLFSKNRRVPTDEELLAAGNYGIDAAMRRRAPAFAVGYEPEGLGPVADVAELGAIGA